MYKDIYFWDEKGVHTRKHNWVATYVTNWTSRKCYRVFERDGLRSVITREHTTMNYLNCLFCVRPTIDLWIDILVQTQTRPSSYFLKIEVRTNQVLLNHKYCLRRSFPVFLIYKHPHRNAYLSGFWVTSNTSCDRSKVINPMASLSRQNLLRVLGVVLWGWIMYCLRLIIFD